MEFRNFEIYIKYYSEFKKFYDENIGELRSKSVDYLYNKFLSSKDFGIICLSWFCNQYKVVDEKKWTLNKIKYAL
jgi:hypothetical protein